MTELGEEDFNKLYNKGHEKFETIRTEVYSKIMGDSEISQPKAKEYMQKAYVNYATFSSTSKSTEKVTRARWPSMVQQVAYEHSKLINDMAKGKFYENIQVDPRDNYETADEKVDLKSLSFANYTSQKTMLDNSKVHVRPVKRGADKYVKKMLSWAREVKERLAAKKEAEKKEGEQDPKPEGV